MNAVTFVETGLDKYVLLSPTRSGRWGCIVADLSFLAVVTLLDTNSLLFGFPADMVTVTLYGALSNGITVLHMVPPT